MGATVLQLWEDIRSGMSWDATLSVYFENGVLGAAVQVLDESETPGSTVGG